MPYDDSSSSLYQMTGSINQQGPQGIPGIQGLAGKSGNTVLSGSGSPASTSGNVGDFYVDLANFLFYGPKDVPGWPAQGVSTLGPLPFGSATLWAPSVAYTAAAPASLVAYNNSLYLCRTAHTSGNTFDGTPWLQVLNLASMPDVIIQALAVVFAKLPTNPPATQGQPWNTGGQISFS